jgi:hypothetical protein
MKQINPGSIYLGQFALMLVITSAKVTADITDLYQEELVYFLCNRELTKMCIPALDERHLFQVE